MKDWLDEIKWDRDGLVPAIAQDHKTGRILMMAWMNREALALTAACSGGSDSPEDAKPQSLSSQTDRESTATATADSTGPAAAGETTTSMPA